MTDDLLIDLREEIDALDQKMLNLLSKRASCALKVGELKLFDNKKPEELAFYRPERESQVLRNIMQKNQGPLEDHTVAHLFREIMSACLAIEKPLQIAYLGPEGTFTQQAVNKHFGHAVISKPFRAIDEIFREVSAGAVNYGVIPVENSSEGMVNHTLDSFIENSVQICGEVVLPIHQHLLISEHTRLDSISRVYSHAQSFAQCRKWLDANLPSVERIPVSSNGDAAKRITSEWHSAAIAGSIAADLYNLQIKSENIEDRPDNLTRFLIIGNRNIPPSGKDKTSIVVGFKNQPGALLSVLEVFKTNNIDLTRIESRPAPNEAWNYIFFIDFKGHKDQPVINEALESLSEKVEVKILGSYPEGVF